MNHRSGLVRHAVAVCLAAAAAPTAALAQGEPNPPAPVEAPPAASPPTATPPAATPPDVTPPAPPPAGAAPTAPPWTPPPAAPLPPVEAPAAVQKGGADDGYPLAGWHSGLFYLRDPHDNFRLYIQGRAQVDAYTYFGPGVSDTTLKPTVFVRRLRPEIAGEFFHRVWFFVSGDFGATGLDNPKGTNEISAAPPGMAPTDATGRYASAQGVRFSAQPADIWVNVKAHDLFNAQIGQFDAPFTMENRTSDKYIPFMERSFAVRDVGIPTNKEIGLMLWGESPNKLLYWAAAVFNGEGQNRLNTDSAGEGMGRLIFHPLYSLKDVVKDLQVGASIRYGYRDQKFTAYDYPAMTTQGNFTFWSPNYSGAKGPTHIIPSGSQFGAAFDARIPIWIFDVMSEFVYIHNDTREAIEGFEATNTERLGRIKGYSYYVEADVWAFGKRDIQGLPGYEGLPHVDFGKDDPKGLTQALQILVKWEQLHLNYGGASREGTSDEKNVDGDIKVDAFSVGANYWFTKHVRFTANYVLNMFPGSAPVKPTTDTSPKQTSDQRAVSPGNTLAPGVNDDARNDGHFLHELLFRVGVAL